MLRNQGIIDERHWGVGAFTRRVFRCYPLSAQGSRGMHWEKRGVW